MRLNGLLGVSLSVPLETESRQKDRIIKIPIRYLSQDSAAQVFFQTNNLEACAVAHTMFYANVFD